MNSENFHIIINGSGLTGATLALALANTPLKIALLEAQPAKFHRGSIEDLRSLALSHVSQKILQGLGIWCDLADYAMPIKQIHISDRGHFGMSRIHASQYQLPALGYVVPITQLIKSITQKLQQKKNVTCINISELQNFTVANNEIVVEINSSRTAKKITAKLLVGADGGSSKVRELMGTRVIHKSYGQIALVANVGLARAHDFTAYERFTESGPLALLPLAEKCYALVWTLRSDELEKISKLTNNEFLSALQQAFGYRLGRFTWVGKRQSFPLSLIQAKEQIAERCVLMGNASHTLHPIAGQGFNLGLRDVVVLSELLKQESIDMGSAELLNRYAQLRHKDQRSIIRFTDNLVNLFSSRLPLLALLRNLGLVGLDCSMAKRFLARKAMGFIKPLPDLALGN